MLLLLLLLIIIIIIIQKSKIDDCILRIDFNLCPLPFPGLVGQLLSCARLARASNVLQWAMQLYRTCSSGIIQHIFPTMLLVSLLGVNCIRSAKSFTAWAEETDFRLNLDG